MKSNWHELRTWNGSQEGAFEALCCQLAEYEQVPLNSIFERKGTPDAGVECYWILPNQDEWCWQAKFFKEIPNETQLKEIDKSVKTALLKHPRMRKYYICLPLDKPDSRIPNQKSFAVKWVARIKKWESWISPKREKIQFIYWGEHEIFERLSRAEHNGRHLFWFRKELLSKQWYMDKMKEAICSAGPRYTPEIDVELPVGAIFSGFSHIQAFYDTVINLYAKIRIAFNEIDKEKSLQGFDGHYSLIENTITELLIRRELLINNRDQTHDFGEAIKLSEICINYTSELIDILKTANSVLPNTSLYTNGGKYDFTISKLHNLTSNLYELIDYFKDEEVIAYNSKTLLVTGEAGTGKTHLLCDICKQFVEDEIPSVLLFGEKFDNTNPFQQILRLLDINILTFDQFLGTLEANAEARNSFAFLIIDALNEGDGRTLWNRYLAEFIQKILKYKLIRLVLSIRNSYREIVIPSHIDLFEITHEGFSGNLLQATNVFFDYYKIQRPSIPILNPEFSNPLFLKTFCEALSNNGMTQIPSGISGITSIFEFYIDSIEKKLSLKLDYDPRDRLVKNSILGFSHLLVENKANYINSQDAKIFINKFLPNRSYDLSLFKHLLSEGVLTENAYYEGLNDTSYGIRLTYEKIGDHFKAQYYIERIKDICASNAEVQVDDEFKLLFKDQNACWYNKGVIESLSIQIPEILQVELFELVPNSKNYSPFIRSFIDSLIWRNENSFFDSTIEYINKSVLYASEFKNDLISAFLTVSNNPQHPYNINRLHLFWQN